MYQQHGIGWLGLLRAPRIGIGALAMGMAGAFIAGGIVVSIAVGSHPAVPSATITTVTRPNALAEDVRREAGNASSSGQTHLTRELLADDFAAAAGSRPGPIRTRELLADDFVPAVVSRPGTVKTRERLAGDTP
jgi:hypothetical protein